MVNEELDKQKNNLSSTADKIFTYSKLVATEKNPELLSDFITFIRQHSDELSLENKYFLFSQLNHLVFVSPEYYSNKPDIFFLYKNVLDEYKTKIISDLSYIPISERNPNLTIVITGQILAIQHGPTKTTFDRIRVLQKKLHQEVLLIDTASIMPPIGVMDYYGMSFGNYLPELSDEDAIEKMGVKTAYFQCDQNMPDIPTMELLIKQIRKLKPRHIISIGADIFSDIVDSMVPVLTVGLIPSSLSNTVSSFQTLARDLSPNEISALKKAGLTEKNVIKSIFTSGLKEQTEHTNRKMLGLPEDAFIIAVVGGRLGDEVTDEFLGMLEKVLARTKIFIVYMGYFNNINEKMERHPSLISHTKYLGMVDDILSRIELMNLYVNPRRTGGGTSAVEALSKGVPVVTIDYGDVAINTGKDFTVKDYAEMAETIIRYIDDKDFYKTQSVKAKKRSEILLDSDGQFVKLIQEYEKSEKELFER